MLSSVLTPLRRRWPFVLGLGIFYTAWLAIDIRDEHGETVRSDWPIALAMSLPSIRIDQCA